MSMFAVVAFGLVAFVGRVRHAEDEVRRLHEQTATVLEQMPVGVLVVNRAGFVEFCNTALVRILGMTIRVGQTLASVRAERPYTSTRVIDGRPIQTDERPLSRALQGEMIRDEEIHVVRGDGAELVVSASAAPISGHDGAVTGAVMALTDTTQRRRIENQLLRREEELRVATLAAEVGVWTWSPSKGTVSVGGNWRSLFDVAPDAEVTFDTWTSALHPEDRERAVETLNAAWQEHGQFAVEYRVVRRDGSIRWLIDRGSATDNEDGTATSMSGINLDITKRKHAEEEAQQATERYERLFGAIREGFAHYQGVYEDGQLVDLRVLEINPAGAALSGVPSEVQTGKTWKEVRPGAEESIFAHYQKAAGTGAAVRFDEYNRLTGRWYDVLAHPIEGGEFAVTFSDITERKELEESLRDANRLKDEFLATLSHELRTPLNAIVGWSDMLRRGSLNPKDTKRATDSIYRNAQAQSEMIADVLDVSRIVSGKVQIEPTPMDLPALLHNAVDSLRAAANTKGVELLTEISSVAYPVSGDSTRMQQVFWNLLSNAVKFTPAGGSVRVSLRLAHGQAEVTVSDTGMGIPPAFLPHVFERFRQRDSSSTRSHGGLGLGLAIVKHLVELHGGTVTAESAGEGEGATFTVRLPALPFEDRRRDERRAVRNGPPVSTVPDDVPSLCGTRVLVVDDQPDARDLSASVLRNHGATVAIAASATQALDQFVLFDPHVLLVDLAMPEMDGFALLERIRKSEGRKGQSVPAIAFTAYAREEDRRRTLAKGFQLHLAKPVDAHRLVRAVDSVRQR